MRRRLLTALAAIALPFPALAAPISILLLGDSITEGVQSEPAGPRYAELLERSLGGDGFSFTTVGCGGASSLDWSPSHASALCGGELVPPGLYEALAKPRLPADLVTVLLGTNDALAFFELERTPAEIYRTAIAELAASLLADGAGRVLLLTPPRTFYDAQASPFLESYREAVFELCSRPGDATLCGPDLHSLLVPEDFEPGQVHPNGFGHAKIAAALEASVRAAVPEPGSAALLASGLALLALRRPRAD